MEQTLSSTAAVSDAELISAVRAGDNAAYGDLFDRHRDAARRLAGQLVRVPDADDLVAESFVRVLVVLQDGRGPDLSFRAYLLTSIRRLHIDRIRASSKVRSTDDEAELDRAVEFVDPAEMRFEHGAAAAAFASLPERWQLVLWHLDVEGQKPADIAPLLDMSANSVSALAYRAREGLRQAYLQGHLAPSLHESCRNTTSMLGAYVRKGLSARDTTKVEAHLDDCSRCTGLLLELREVNSNLSGVLGPSLLGPAFAGYVAAGAGAVAVGVGAGAGASAVSLVGVKLVTGGAVKLAVVPAKIIGAAVAGAGTQGVVAVAVVTGVATAGTVAVTTDFGRSPSPATSSAAPATSEVPAVPAVPAPAADEGEPSTESDAAPEPSPEPVPTTAEPVPAATPDVAPIQAPDPEPTPTPSESAETSEPVGPEPAPEVEAPAPTDYGVGPVTIANDGLLLRRTFTIPVTATSSGRPSDQPVTVTMTFSRPALFKGVISPGWDCGGAAVGQAVTTLSCTTTPAAGQGTTFVVRAAGIRPDGTITVTSPGDPQPANDSVPFAATPFLVLL